MATLTNTKIKDTYDGLLKTTDNDVIGASEKVITDGLGNASVLSIGTASASFSSDIEVNTLTIGLGSGSIATNTAIGLDALFSNTSGSGNVSVGQGSMRSNTTGLGNVSVGKDALRLNTTGNYNVAIGYVALYSNIDGAFNVAVGYSSLNNNTEGQNNTAIGYTSANSNTTGLYNTALGSAALYANQTSGNNTALGYFALRNNIAANNTAVGSGALADNTTGGSNVAVGKDALNSNTVGSNITAIGRSSMANATAGNNNTALGFYSLVDNQASNNVAVGDFALRYNTTGGYNTALGSNALRDNTTGVSNVAIGYDSLSENTTGGYNTSVGAYTLEDNTTGSRNTAVGFNTLDSNTEGSDNTAIGHGALDGNTTGDKNTAVGRAALLRVSTGFQNTALGFEAADDITTGSNNIHIGYQATASSATVSNEIVIGSGATGKGSDTALIAGDNVYLGDGTLGGATIERAANPIIRLIDTTNSETFNITNNFSGGQINYNATTLDHRFKIGGTDKLTIGSSTVSVSGNLAVDTNTLYVDAANNKVGINNSTPNSFFSNASQLVVGDGSTSRGMTIYGSSAGDSQIFFADGTTGDEQYRGAVRYEHSSDSMVMFTSGSEKMRIDSSGNVKIGGIKLNPTGAGGELLFGSDVTTYAGIKTTSPAAQDIDLTFHTTTNAGSDGAPERMRIDSSGNVQLQTVNAQLRFQNSVGPAPFIANAGTGDQDLYISTGGSESMRIDSSGAVYVRPIATYGSMTTEDNIIYQRTSGGGYASISFGNSFNSNNSTIMAFKTSNDGTTAERMRITSGGQLLFNTQTYALNASNWALIPNSNYGGELVVARPSTFTGTGNTLLHYHNSTYIGGINTTTTGTVFLTSSDYRLKENVVEMTGALDRVDALKPSRFNFIGDEKTVDGFLAHEVAEVVPEAISGEKDAVDEEGNPIYQGIDQSKIVPLLVGAIKELRAEIELLKSQLS